MREMAGSIYNHNNSPPYFCKSVSDLLTDAPTTELVFALAPPISPAMEQERDRLRYLAGIAHHRLHELRSIFPADLFRDANWTIMMACFIALLEGEARCVKHIQSLLDDSHTAVLRHIDALENHGLIGRQRDPVDGRRTLVLLTGRGAAAMASYMMRFGSDLDKEANAYAPPATVF